jgi:2',3'-cyclic-nucleotide 2'-phosphodiesterase (5'-nucleotidase family)
MPKDDVVEKEVEKLEGFLEKELFEKIGNLEVSWKLENKNTESGAGNFEADVLREITDADIAFVNTGSVRKSMSPGDITSNDIWEIFPFDDEAYRYEMSGQMIRDILEHNCSGRSDILQVSGLKYRFDSEKPVGKRLISIHVDGEALDTGIVYKVAMLDYVAHLSKRYFGFDIKEMDYKNFGTFGKKEIADYIKKQKIVKTGIEGRIVDIRGDR